MTPEQELTAMIEDEMLRIAAQVSRDHEWRNIPIMSRKVHDEIIARRSVGTDSQLNLLYCLATDPDDMVH